MEEFKDENNPVNQQEQEPLERLIIRKQDQPDYDPDDDLIFEISPIAAAFIGLAGGFFLYQIVGAILTLIIFGTNLDAIPVNSLRLMTMAGQILFILLPALLFAKWIYSDVGKIIRIRKPDIVALLLFIVGIIIITLLLQSFLYIQNYYIEIWAKNIPFVNSVKSFFDMVNDMVEKTYGDLITAHNIFELLLVITVVAVVPALAEESMFRGFIQRSFELKMKKYWAVIITALFFSLYHFNPYGFVPLFILGGFFGFAAYKTKSLVIPMILHFLNNFSAVLLYHIMGDDELIKSDAAINSNDLSFYVGVFFGLSILFAGLIILINKYYSLKKIKEE